MPYRSLYLYYFNIAFDDLPRVWFQYCMHEENKDSGRCQIYLG